ncbi:MAG: PAS domain-containing protein [Deltaproteobacteria bacterium]|nr:PAS domain-containing protein [Deltaproteobacteria bacterium]
MKQTAEILAALNRTIQDLVEDRTPPALDLPPRESPFFPLCRQVNRLLAKQRSTRTAGEIFPGAPDHPGPLLEAVLQHAPYGIISVTQEGRISFCNQLAGFMLDETRKTTLSGANLFAFLESRQVDTGTLRELMGSPPRRHSQRTTITFPDQQNPISLSLTIVGYRGRQEEEQLFVIFIEDLTGKTTLADAIQFYTENLESMVAEKTREIQAMQAKLIASERAAAMVTTAGGIAHELRQPLTAIIGNLELLTFNHEQKEEDPVQKKLNLVLQLALRMADIIKKMEQLVEYQTRDYVSGTRILDLDESSADKK